MLKEKTLAELETENVQLKRELTASLKTIDKLLKDMNKKSEEIANLQSMLTKTVPVIKTPDKKSIISQSAENEIAENQLERLRTIAKTRPLTLEEVKVYDLLVKNKRLSQDESTINLNKNGYRDVTDTDLLKIAESSNEPNQS